MTVAHITPELVKKIKLPHGLLVKFVWDTATKGFGLRVTQNRKTFVLQYRLPETQHSKRVKLGSAPTMSVQEARTIAHQMLTDVKQRTQSAPELPSSAPLLTVNALLDKFVAEHVRRHCKISTAREEVRLIDRLIRPAFGELELTKLSRRMVADWHVQLATRTSANRALAHLSRACSFAMERDMMDRNPCQGIRRNKETPKDRYFTDDELARIGAALHVAGPEAADAIRLLALTGWRASELISVMIEDINLEREVVIIRDSKTGRKASRLNSHALELVRSVIGSKTAGELFSLNYSRLEGRITKVLRMAEVEDASAHTFRHTLATYMAEHGDSITTIAAMGGWRTLAMIQRYVSLHGVGKPHPLTAHERIWRAIAP